MVAIVLISITILIVQIWFCTVFAEIAEKKGYSKVSYGCVCFFLGIIGYCLVAALPDLYIRETISTIEQKIEQLGKSLAIPTPENAATPPIPPIKSTNATTSENPLLPISCNDGEIICPTCNTKQRADRKVCWSCGQTFL